MKKSFLISACLSLAIACASALAAGGGGGGGGGGGQGCPTGSWLPSAQVCSAGGGGGFVAQAAGGLWSMNGYPDRAPVRVGSIIAAR